MQELKNLLDRDEISRTENQEQDIEVFSDDETAEGETGNTSLAALGIGKGSEPMLSQSENQDKLTVKIVEVSTPDIFSSVGSPLKVIERQPSKKGMSRDSSKVGLESSEVPAVLSSQESFHDEPSRVLSKSKSGVNRYDTAQSVEQVSEKKVIGPLSRGPSAKLSDDKSIDNPASISPSRKVDVENMSSPKPIAKRNLNIETKSGTNQQSDQVSPSRRTEKGSLLSPKNSTKK